MNDKRYSIQLEYCGYAKRRYVVRFCGDWIGTAATGGKAKAEEIARRHAAVRHFQMTGKAECTE